MSDLVIVRECSDLVFSHYIGSQLFNNRTSTSDCDVLKVHKTKLYSIDDCLLLNNFLNISDQNFFEVPSFEEKNINKKVIIEDSLSIDFLTLILYLIDDKKINTVILSKVVSHLYAIKYNLITDIKNYDIYNFYLNWLNSPGVGSHFWYKYKQILWLTISSLPDKDFNWSQKYDNSDEHKNSKKNWDLLEGARYPSVDNKLGYDPIETKRIIQDLMICTSILTHNPLCQEDKEILTDLKNHQVNFNDYSSLKKKTWKKFRVASESLNSVYFLGSGYSLEKSKTKETYGILGLKNLFNSVSNIKELAYTSRRNL